MWFSLLLAWACAPAPIDPRGRPDAAAERPAHLVLIVWNDTQPSRMGFLNASEANSPTPTLDALAGRGCVFPRAVAALDHGRPKLGALLTGAYPQVSGIYTHAGARVPGDKQTLPERLQAAGWATFAAGRFKEGFAQRLGFEATADDVLGAEAGVLDRYLAEGRGERRLFLWWAPSAPTTERNPAPALDAGLAHLVAQLERAGLLADTLFAFVTDGEADGSGLPGDVASERQTAAPVFFSGPGSVRPAVSALPVTIYDVQPTLLDFAGLPPAATAAGRSLRPVLEGAAPEAEAELTVRPRLGAFFERSASRASKGGKFPEKDVLVLSWRRDSWKYVLYLGDVGIDVNEYSGTARVGHAAGDQTLHDLAADPEEAHDLSGEPREAARLEALRGELLAAWKASGGGELRLPYLTPTLGPVPAAPVPNIVLVLSDDQDWEHLGLLGHPLGHQPTLDALARSGFVFPVAHVPMSRCRPSQAALLSGRWPHETHITDNDTAHPLARRDSLPNLLKGAGYATFQGGKMWEGDSQAMGFLEPTTADLHFLRFVREGQAELDGFIDRYHAERPLFVWWAPTLPHVPHDPPQRLKERFRDAPVNLPPNLVGDPQAFREAERTSYAMEAWFDEGLAALVAKLESVGELEDTLFVFLVDNGWANGYPSKGTVFEKGLRTPVVFSWKKGLAGGRSDERLVSTLDVYPTILDFAGVPAPAGTRGVSLRPVLEGREAPRRSALHGAQYLYRLRIGPPRPERDVVALYARTERWKYVLYLKDVDDPKAYDLQTAFASFPARARGDRNLYDLVADPHEQNDLARDPAQAERVAELEAGCLAWWSEVGGPALDVPGPKDDNRGSPRRR